MPDPRPVPPLTAEAAAAVGVEVDATEGAARVRGVAAAPFAPPITFPECGGPAGGGGAGVGFFKMWHPDKTGKKNT